MLARADKRAMIVADRDLLAIDKKLSRKNAGLTVRTLDLPGNTNLFAG